LRTLIQSAVFSNASVSSKLDQVFVLIHEIRACTPLPHFCICSVNVRKLNAQRIFGQLPHSLHHINANGATMLELLCGACCCEDRHVVGDAEGDLGKSSRISPTFWFLTTRSVL
jgi:hypothetical protein